jgi:ABC-2 type transport system ATP-binding protein
MDAVLEVSGLTRQFGDRLAVSGLSFHIRRAEAVGLLGVNGAGKSTTLRLIAGYLVPHAGTAKVEGFDVSTAPREVRRRVGYLAEGAPAYSEMRVEPYLRFRARVKELGRRAGAEVDRVLERCGLLSERRTIIAQLSRGYRQRVGIADALLGSPPLLLLDEPSSGLDPAQVRELRALLSAIAAERAVLLSSHALSDVEAICTRLVVLSRGRLVAEGTPGTLRAGGLVRLVVEVRGSPDLVRQALATVPGLGTPEPLRSEGETSRFAADITHGDPRAAAARALLAAGLDLFELRTESPSLEEVVVSLLAERSKGDA